jgi:DNA repair protein RadC
MSGNTKDHERYDRYHRVVTAAMVAESFELADIQAACPHEMPGFVTRVVNQMQETGLLERSGSKAKPSFRWLTERAQPMVAEWVESQVYNTRLTRAPLQERPRERLLAYGAAALRTAELLAILIRSGRKGESALQAGESIATRFGERLDRLPRTGRGELAKISPAVGETAYCQIMAGIELGRRVAKTAADRQQPVKSIRSTGEAVAYCRETFSRLAHDAEQEEFRVVTLNTKNHVIDTHAITRGLLDQTVVHPREVFRVAIGDAAKSVILVHNHPSGDPTPSPQDLALTQRLEEAGTMLGIQVLDHIIVARHGETSIREHQALRGAD